MRDPRRDVRSANNKPGVKKTPDSKAKPLDNKRANNNAVSDSIFFDKNISIDYLIRRKNINQSLQKKI
jgi:hypothetical protein